MQHTYVLKVSLITALGGFLLGFDTAVISGANLYIQSYFELDEVQFGFVVSSMLIGCALGGVLFGPLTGSWGRKKMLLVTGILFFISALGSALSTSVTAFILYRIVGGVGVGAASMLSPLYIAEVSPAAIRGRMVSLNQLTIVLGITISFFSNYYFTGLPETISWRWMLGIETVPAFLFIALLFLVPESPRWLYSKQRMEEANAVLAKIYGPEKIVPVQKGILADLKASSKTGDGQTNVQAFQKLWTPKYRGMVAMAIIFAVLQQVTGVNVLMYYTPNIFEQIGLGKSSAIFQTISVGITMSVFTILAMSLIDRVGRKKLMLFGAMGMATSLMLLGFVFSMANLAPIIFLLLILCFIAFFSLSAGPVTWVLISEILPNEIRSRAIGVATFFLWIGNFVVTYTFPILLEFFEGSAKGLIFVLFGLFCLVLFAYTKRRFTETKGKTLEEIHG